ncbi:hypothetical protein CLF_100863 [Clonorchis sinensis]|uniref:Uncharacterized protein n=1 Tax=Clonorchis sinensis TaxID=79923 RepID=G7Y4F2_CLOSI|nr:hypothetical protein CLF_100863 [Clonorchis sinensis]
MLWYCHIRKADGKHVFINKPHIFSDKETLYEQETHSPPYGLPHKTTDSLHKQLNLVVDELWRLEPRRFTAGIKQLVLEVRIILHQGPTSVKNELPSVVEDIALHSIWLPMDTNRRLHRTAVNLTGKQRILLPSGRPLDTRPKLATGVKPVTFCTHWYTGRIITGAGQGGVACWYTPLSDLDLFFCTSRDLYPLFRFPFRCRIHVCLQRGRSASLSVRRACCASTVLRRLVHATLWDFGFLESYDLCTSQHSDWLFVHQPGSLRIQTAYARHRTGYGSRDTVIATSYLGSLNILGEPLWVVIVVRIFQGVVTN